MEDWKDGRETTGGMERFADSKRITSMQRQKTISYYAGLCKAIITFGARL
jgi:hypothetical protein